MRNEVQSAIRMLFGDDEKADAFVEAVEAANQEIRERGLVTREDKPVEVPKTEEAPKPAADEPAEEKREAPVAAQVAAEPPPPVAALPLQVAEEAKEQVLVLDDAAIAAIAAAIPGTDLSTLTAQLQVISDRLAKLERSDEQRHQEWKADLPAKRSITVTTRPRVDQAPEAQPDEKGQPGLATRAAATLARMPRQR